MYTTTKCFFTCVWNHFSTSSSYILVFVYPLWKTTWWSMCNLPRDVIPHSGWQWLNEFFLYYTMSHRSPQNAVLQTSWAIIMLSIRGSDLYQTLKQFVQTKMTVMERISWKCAQNDRKEYVSEQSSWESWLQVSVTVMVRLVMRNI